MSNKTKRGSAPYFFCLLFAWIFGHSTTFAQQGTIQHAFETQGFQCQLSSPSRGVVCICEPHTFACRRIWGDYPEPIALIVPPQFSARGPLELTYFFHGHNAPGVHHSSITQLLVRKRLAEGLAESGRNSLLIVPLASQNQPAEHHGRIATHFAEFTARILTLLQRVELTPSANPSGATILRRISLASSSGGCFPVQDILRQSETRNSYRSLIQEVFLFDSVYEPTPSTFSTFSGRLWASYSGPNENRALRILRARTARGESCIRANWFAHPAAPARFEVQSSACGFVFIGPGDQNHAAHIPSLFGRLLAPPLNRAN